ncbi:MAG: phage tail fiber protein [Alphaproteobacteria bacterium]|nr:phage tail fiber protein [Alphaproteobacteria bacterium]
MTETTEKNHQQWPGNDVTTIFSPSSMNVRDQADLAVYVDDTLQVITTDYSVGIISQVATVTFVTAPATGEIVTIVREEPLEQSTDLTTINTFRAEGFEGALDSIVRQIYRLWHKVTRSLTLPDSNVDGSGQFDARSNRIGNVGDPTDGQDAVTKEYAENRYALQSAGGGDMFKAVYDTDGDGKVNEAITADIAPWSGLTGIPASFTPATHTHTATDVDDFNTATDARIASSAQDVSVWETGTGITEGVVSPAKIAAAIAAIAPGGGDMIKATYDSNNNGKVDAADAADVAPWAGLTGVPATFAPSAHSHTASEVTDFNASADARISAAVSVSVQAYDADTAKTDVAQTFSALQACSVETLVDGAIITPTGTQNAHQVTIGGNRTMAAPSSITAGATYVFKIVQDGIGSRTIAWSAAYDWPGGTPPTLTTGAAGIDIVSGFSFDGTSIQMLTPGQDFS